MFIVKARSQYHELQIPFPYFFFHCVEPMHSENQNSVPQIKRLKIIYNFKMHIHMKCFLSILSLVTIDNTYNVSFFHAGDGNIFLTFNVKEKKYDYFIFISKKVE